MVENCVLHNFRRTDRQTNRDAVSSILWKTLILQRYKKGLKGDLYQWSLFINSLTNNKILDWSKLKAFADDKINVNEVLKTGLGRGKGENASYQHFLLFPQCFQKPSVSGSLKVGIVW